SYAQDIAVLRREPGAASSDSTRIVAFQNLVNHYKYGNADSALHYAKEGLTFARKKHYKFGEAVMINTIAQVNERHGNLEKANRQYQQARALFQELGYTKGVASTTN